MGNSSSTGAAGSVVLQESSKDFSEVETLGKGSFGVVKLVMRKKDTRRFALKKISYGGFFSAATKEMIAKEILVQKNFNHPNITKLESFWYEPGILGGSGYLLLEYCTNGSARSLAHHNSTRYSHKFSVTHKESCWKFAEQMLLALVYVHDRNVIHRDLKLENILIHGDGSFKLTDFGVSVGRSEGLKELQNKLSNPAARLELLTENSVRTRSACGTMIYMAPEMFTGSYYGREVDVYALGLALRELLYGASIVRDASFNMDSVLREKSSVVSQTTTYYWAFLYLLPILVHRNMYTFLAIHILMHMGWFFVAQWWALSCLSDAMICADPKERPNARDSLEHVRWCRYALFEVYPKWVNRALLVLYPLDVCGLSVARVLTSLILWVNLAFSLWCSSPRAAIQWTKYLQQSRR